jgi:hypothetical protein
MGDSMWELLHVTFGAKVKITLKFLDNSEIVYKEEQKIVYLILEKNMMLNIY